MTSPKLYDFPESGNSYKVRLLINLLNLPVDIEKMDALAGACRTEDFKKKNVDQRLPLLELPDGTRIAESNAILHYLARGSDLASDDPVDEAQILRWMFFEQNQIESKVAEVRFIYHYVPIEKQNKPFLEELANRANRALQVMDDHLEKNDFFACNRFTIADIALYAYTHVAGEAGFELSHFPNIQTWIKRVEERERFIPFTER
ncbi:MAG: glutathione S-transferase family protein [Alphaproteobacteria bacterium]|nr:MAG: glutathione S-transferase family protein [Alphaproteobacteria bacterium]